MLDIVKYPHPILEKEAQEVSFPLNREDRELVAKMIETMESVDGVGLAANQVGVLKKICVLKMLQKHRKVKTEHLVLFNPKIIMESEVRCLFPEGCLSFPDQFYYVERPCNVIVEYQDKTGKTKQLQANKFLSSQIQHETDHLYGVLYTSKAKRKIPQEDLEEKPEFVE
jgi:peptide deformylase